MSDNNDDDDEPTNELHGKIISLFSGKEIESQAENLNYRNYDILTVDGVAFSSYGFLVVNNTFCAVAKGDEGIIQVLVPLQQLVYVCVSDDDGDNEVDDAKKET
jgi:hypothetical protein